MRWPRRGGRAQTSIVVRASHGGGPTETLVTGSLHGAFEWPPGIVVFDGAHLDGVSLAGPRTVKVTIRRSTFRACDFSGLVFTSSFFGTRQHSHFEDCSFVGADFRGSLPGDARFVRCDFSEARLDAWGPAELEFIDCAFSGTIRNVAFTATARRDRTEPSRSSNVFVGNDLRRCELISVAFHGGIDLDAQLLPDDDIYMVIDRFPERLPGAKRWLAERPKTRQRDGAIWAVESLMRTSSTQRCYWLRRGEWPDLVLEALGVSVSGDGPNRS